MSSGLPNRGSLPSPEGQLRMPPRVIASTCCSLRVRAGACSSRPGRVLAHLWVSVSGRFHDAFVTLPFYNSIREDEARHLESGTQSCRLGLCVRKCPPKTFARSAERRSSGQELSHCKAQVSAHLHPLPTWSLLYGTWQEDFSW